MLAKNLISTVTQIPAEPAYWIATLGGTGADYSYGVAVDGDENVYIAGVTSSQGAGGDDALIVKYDTSGAIQWQRSLGGSGSDYANAVAVDSSGNVYVAGSTTSQGAGVADVLITKYNTSGTIQWQRSLGGAGSDIGRSIAVDSSGNVYVAGQTASQGAGSNDFLITKYNTSGTIQWQRSLGGASNDTGQGIAVDSSGYVYVTGQNTSQGAGNIDFLIAKYNTSGTIQWQRSLGGASNDNGQGIAVDSSGNVYIIGYTDSQSAGSFDVLIAKYNTSGTIQWQRRLGGASVELGYGCAVDSSGNVYITGYTASQGAGGNDLLIAKYDTSGTIQWQRSLGGPGTERGYGIAVDSSGNVYISGYTTSQGAGGDDVLIAKLPGDGSLTGTYGNFTYAATTLTDAATTLTSATSTLTDAARTLTSATSTLTDAARTLTSTTTIIPVAYWIATLGGSGEDQGYDIAVDSGGNVYITGLTDSQGAGSYDMMVAKYDTSGTIQWQRRLGGAGSDVGRGIAVDSSGNVYVGGYTASQGAGSFDFLITKYDTSGTIQWQRSLGGGSTDYGYGIAVDSSGNVYVAGQTASQGAGSNDFLITKYNTSGTIQWQRSLGGAGSEIGYGIAVDSSGNVYITGLTASQGAGSVDVLIAKYDTSGTIQWQRSLGGTSSEEGNGIAVDSSGNVYITGYTNSQGAGDRDVLITKYNTSGTIQWQRSLGGASFDVGVSIAVDIGGNVYVTGYEGSQSAGLGDVLIAKYNTSGTIQWQRSLGGSSNDRGYGIAVDGSGNVYVTGYTSSQGAGSLDILIAKLPANGGLTGTYGSLTYAATTLTSATTTLTSATSTLTSATTTLTSATSTLTGATTTLTSSTTTIQTGA